MLYKFYFVCDLCHNLKNKSQAIELSFASILGLTHTYDSYVQNVCQNCFYQNLYPLDAVERPYVH